MKFYLSQIGALLARIAKGEIKALLLYGPDKGYIDKICTTIIKTFDLLQTSIEYSDLKNQSLVILLNSQNFFMKRKLLKIRSVTSSVDQALQIALGEDFYHFAIFIANELPFSSSIRKLFETENHLASIACYHDDAEKIVKIILHKCSKVSKVIKEDALAYLTSHLQGDHQLICSELDKLIYFTYDKDQISYIDVQSVVSSNLMASEDDLCIYLLQKDHSNFLEEFAKLQQQNINEILIIRTLIKYYLNFYVVLSKIENGDNVNNAMKSLSPPIFYKYINNFKKIVNELTINDCINALLLLQQAEIDFKLKPNSFNLYRQLYLQL